MKKLYPVFVLIFLCILSDISAYAQNYWNRTIETQAHKIPIDKGVARKSFPTTYRLFDLNISPLQQKLFSVTDNLLNHSTLITLPNAEGNLEYFEVFEASNFEPALQAQFPNIRAFSGRGLTDKAATLKLSLSPAGIQTMVFRAGKAK